jgi:hypothetical protein
MFVEIGLFGAGLALIVYDFSVTCVRIATPDR